MRFAPVGQKSRVVLSLSTASIEAYEGAVRSSKTITSLLDFARFVRQAPAGELAIVGRTERTAARNIIEPLTAMFGRFVSYNRGTSTLTLFGRTVYVIGANNEASRTKIQGMTLVGLYIDEAAVIPESFFNMAYTRLSVAGAKMWLTANPEGRSHWLLTKWLERGKLHVRADGAVEHLNGPLDLHRYTFVLDDNPFLAPEFVARLKASYTGVWYLRFILSQWTNAEGAIYDQFDPAKHVVGWSLLPRMRRILGVGADYGTTNATAAIALGWGEDGKLYALDEWRHDTKTGEATWTDAQLSAGVRAWLPGPHTPHPAEPDPEWLFVDPAAASFKTQLYYDGLRNVANADNDVVTGIRATASLMAAGKLLVSDRCAGLLKEIPGYVWDSKAAAAGEDKPVKADDHSLDALRYAVQSTRNVWARELLGVA